MQYHQDQQLNNWQTLSSIARLFEQLKQPASRASVLLMSVGIGLSGISPANAASNSVKTTPVQQKTQLISQSPKTVNLTFVSYSVTKAAYDRIIPQFVAKWKKQTKQNVNIQQSYGGSGSQARAVIDGLDADVVALSLAQDVKKIEQAGLIKSGWEREQPNNSIVTRSVVALVTRPGNPKGIRTWTDLVKPGIGVITPNPKTSGGAQWNFLALWGAVTRTGGNESKARQFVTQVFKNVPILPKDARSASDTFYKQGQGDVLVTYENEVLLAKLSGQGAAPFVVPQTNISIENPVAVVDRNAARHGNQKVADAFVKFLYTPEAQREFAKVGFRPVNGAVSKQVQSKFPKVNKLFTVGQLGGWSTVQTKFFNDRGIFDQIQSGGR